MNIERSAKQGSGPSAALADSVASELPSGPSSTQGPFDGRSVDTVSVDRVTSLSFPKALPQEPLQRYRIALSAIKDNAPALAWGLLTSVEGAGVKDSCDLFVALIKASCREREKSWLSGLTNRVFESYVVPGGFREDREKESKLYHFIHSTLKSFLKEKCFEKAIQFAQGIEDLDQGQAGSVSSLWPEISTKAANDGNFDIVWRAFEEAKGYAGDKYSPHVAKVLFEAATITSSSNRETAEKFLDGFDAYCLHFDKYEACVAPCVMKADCWATARAHDGWQNDKPYEEQSTFWWHRMSVLTEKFVQKYQEGYKAECQTKEKEGNEGLPTSELSSTKKLIKTWTILSKTLHALDTDGTIHYDYHERSISMFKDLYQPMDPEMKATIATALLNVTAEWKNECRTLPAIREVLKGNMPQE